MIHRQSVALLALAGLLAATGVSAGPSVSAATASPPAFTVAPLPQAVGVTYTSAAGERNEDVEPGIGVSGDGTFWVGSNIDVNTSGDPRAKTVIAGEDIWRSTDGGKAYEWVAAPFNETGGTPGAGGEDSDLAVAQVANSNGHYNVYATSLYVAASNMAISQDDGTTWTLISVGGIPAQDRPWLSVDGACTFYLTYHQLPLFSPVVNKYNICSPTSIGMGFSLNPTQSTQVFLSNTAPGLTNGFNKPFVDNSPTSPHQHNLYIPMEACALQSPMDYVNNLQTTAEQIPTCPQGVDTQVEVAVSSDGGMTFNDYVVAMNSNGEQQVWPTSLAVDAAGTVYTAWGDNHHSFVSASSDAGQTWSKPLQLDPPAGTSVYPTIAAGAANQVQVAWYGTPKTGDGNNQTDMGKPGDPAAAPWGLWWATSSDGAKTFSSKKVTGVNHTGVLCTEGSACAGGGARNLYDDFGIAISPTTGRSSIAFDADQVMKATPDAQAVDPFTAFATQDAPAPVAAASPTPSPITSPVAAAPSPAARSIPNTAPGPPAVWLGLAALFLLASAAAALSARRRHGAA